MSASQRQAIKIAFHGDETPAHRALAKALVTEGDLLRLKALARLHARGLPGGVTWSDLLQEAILRMLNGARRQPEGVPVVAFLAGVMRSLRTEYWRRHRDESTAPLGTLPDPAPDPEQQAAAHQQLVALDRLFADDVQALKVLEGLAAGMTAEEIQQSYDLSKTDYDSTRKRMRRVLLREGLAWRPS